MHSGHSLSPTRFTVRNTPTATSSQPTTLPGWRAATSAPTSGNASSRVKAPTWVSTASLRLARRRVPTAPAAHKAAIPQVSRAAVRGVTGRPYACELLPSYRWPWGCSSAGPSQGQSLFLSVCPATAASDVPRQPSRDRYEPPNSVRAYQAGQRAPTAASCWSRPLTAG